VSFSKENPMSADVCIAHHFDRLRDPRIATDNKRHKLLDIVVITILAVLSGAEGWTDIFGWADANKTWLATFLALPNGLPSRDCVRRVVSRIDPDEFQECFGSWMAAVCEATDGEIIAIDGKTLRRSFDRRSGKRALHMVSAWATKNHLLLGQQSVDQKSNEITAIPKLLELLDLTGAIVTIDAMGCQKEIARKIRDGGGHFVLALKGNQSQIHEGVQETFADHLEDDFARVACRQHQTKERSHGRTEERYYYQMKVPAELPGREEWVGLRTIGLVVNVTERAGKTTDEVRYYLSSLPLGVRRFAEAVRSHWRVENSLHWTLDVTFDEDHSRVSKDHGAENLATLRRMALSILKRHPRDKRSVRQRRLRAGWNRSYLLEILAENNAS
jgi:predicted transposase YbfD/YdcC